MAKTTNTKTADGTFESEPKGTPKGGAYEKSAFRYGDLPAEPNVQSWPSQKGMTPKTGKGY